jgi:DNA-binding MarR family transcriptional regulator
MPTERQTLKATTSRRIAESVARIYDLDDEATDRVVVADLLLRVRELVHRDIDANLSQFGTSHARFQVLAILYNEPDGLKLNEIAARASVHPTTMTSTVERLVRDGLVERRATPNNRRTILAVSTREGRKLYRQAQAKLAALEYGFSDVDIKSVRSLIRGLDALAYTFEEANRSTADGTHARSGGADVSWPVSSKRRAASGGSS